MKGTSKFSLWTELIFFQSGSNLYQTVHNAQDDVQQLAQASTTQRKKKRKQRKRSESKSQQRKSRTSRKSSHSSSSSGVPAKQQSTAPKMGLSAMRQHIQPPPPPVNKASFGEHDPLSSTSSSRSSSSMDETCRRHDDFIEEDDESMSLQDDERDYLKGKPHSFFVNIDTHGHILNFPHAIPGQSSRTESSNQLDDFGVGMNQIGVVDPPPKYCQELHARMTTTLTTPEDPGYEDFNQISSRHDQQLPEDGTIFVKRGQQFVQLKPGQVGSDMLRRAILTPTSEHRNPTGKSRKRNGQK